MSSLGPVPHLYYLGSRVPISTVDHVGDQGPGGDAGVLAQEGRAPVYELPGKGLEADTAAGLKSWLSRTTSSWIPGPWEVCCFAVRSEGQL